MKHACDPGRVLYYLLLCVLLVVTAGPAASLHAQVSGANIFQTHCAACHNQPDSRAPSREALQKIPAMRILRSLDFGLMMGVAYTLNREERQAVAEFLGTKETERPFPASAFCSAGTHGLATRASSDQVSNQVSNRVSRQAAASWNGWSPSPSNTRYQTAEQAGLTAAEVPHLTLKWAFGFPSDVTAFAAPTILNGTVFVGSASGGVQALDAQTGCIHWVFQANGPVRSGILAVQRGAAYSLLFGDQIGWFYALDSKSGLLLWKQRVEAHEGARLTGSPVAHEGVVFVPAASWEETRALEPKYPCCTFRGSVTALRVKDGSVVWKSYLVDQPRKTGRVNSAGAEQWGPSGVGTWSAPTIDPSRGVLYVTTGNLYSPPPAKTSDAVVALQIKTGKIVWSQQVTPGDVYTTSCRNQGPNCPPDSGPDYDFGSSAILVHTGSRELLVAGQKSGVVYAFDPDADGKIVWQTRVGKGGRNGGVQWGMASDGRAVYAAVSDLAGVLNFAGPVGGATFDPAQGGGLTALRIEDGEKIWSAQPHPCDPPKPGCSPAQSAALTAIPGVVFSGSIDGHLRAFATEDGKVVWDFDTAREYITINGVPGKGGSLDGPGPAIAAGMVFVNSGYPRTGGMAGNVLLAFTAGSANSFIQPARTYRGRDFQFGAR